jgi:phosphomethylpyrimidine synthase
MSGTTPKKALHVDDERLSGITRQPFAASSKVYVSGTQHPEVRVPLRKIQLADTRHADGRITHNAPVTVYDTTGPYSDPTVEIDLRRGLAPLREKWILGRGDVERLDGLSSAYGRQRLGDERLKKLRFGPMRAPLKAGRTSASCTTRARASSRPRWSSSPFARTRRSRRA